MAGLISRTRLLIGDVSATPPVFSDEQIQDALDSNQFEVRYERTRPLETRTLTSVEWKIHRATVGNWESDVVLLDALYQPLTPDTSDLIQGRWVLPTSNVFVFIVGKNYDIYRAAVYLLEQWQAQLKEQIDFKDNRTEFLDSQKTANIAALIKAYKAKQRARVGRLISTDFNNAGF